jgi:hypothetical protein
MGIEQQNFIQIVPDVGVIANTATAHANLEAIKTEYGHNFNTLIVQNNSTEEISLTVDGRKIVYIAGNGGIFAIDADDKIQWDDLQITNEDAAASTSANEIRITVGRTGM